MKTLIALLLVISLNTQAQTFQGWRNVSPSTTYNIHGDIKAIGENTVYVIFDGGTFISSNDGAVSWQSSSTGVSEDYFKMDFIDTQNGVVVGTNGTLLTTNDAGQNWTQRQTNVTDSLWSVQMYDANHIWASGSQGTLINSNDGGQTWNTIDLQTSNSIYDVLFTDINTGYICGQNGLFKKTTDGGITWNDINLNTTDKLVKIIKKGNLLKVVHQSLDGGFSYSDDEINWNYRQIYEYFDFFDDNISFSVFSGFTTCGCDVLSVYKTTNNWQNGTDSLEYRGNAGNSNIVSVENWNRIAFASENIIYVLSGNVVFKTEDGGTYTSLNKLEDYKNSSVKIYPNPVQDNINIISEKNFNSIKIIDNTGKVIFYKQLDNYQNKLKLQLPEITNGIYLLQVADKESAIIKKIVIEN